MARLRARLATLERERDHLAAIVDILQEVASSLHFIDVLQTIARKLGETFGLDRCVVVPIRWEGSVIGAIFLRTEREAEPFSDSDVRFCQTVASLTAKSLRNAHRFETLLRSQKDVAVAQRRAELQRVALVGFLRRLLDRYAKGEEQSWAETLLPRAADEELERLVTVAMQVLDEEAKG
jgi:GAF domain-containing protein